MTSEQIERIMIGINSARGKTLTITEAEIVLRELQRMEIEQAIFDLLLSGHLVISEIIEQNGEFIDFKYIIKP